MAGSGFTTRLARHHLAVEMAVDGDAAQKLDELLRHIRQHIEPIARRLQIGDQTLRREYDLLPVDSLAHVALASGAVHPFLPTEEVDHLVVAQRPRSYSSQNTGICGNRTKEKNSTNSGLHFFGSRANTTPPRSNTIFSCYKGMKFFTESDFQSAQSGRSVREAAPCAHPAITSEIAAGPALTKRKSLPKSDFLDLKGYEPKLS